jgi:TolB-like protein/DNA-binding SARP family transcriptional activator/Flp pilus assembly protein TadD
VLAVCGDLGCTRERLIALLWPESDETHSRHSLRDALRAIRHALGPDAVLSVGDLLRLDPTVVVSDVLSLTQLLRSGRRADAVRAYGGRLLEGFHVDGAPEFERWLDRERARLAREYVEALDQLAAVAERAGAWDEAAGWWARAVEQDPLNSRLVLRHARALAAIGDRANAIKAADAHARRLREEVDLRPDREFVAEVERIRRGEALAPEGGVPSPAAGATPARPQTAQEPPAGPEPLAMPSGGTGPIQTTRVAAPGRWPRWIPWAAGVAALVLLAGAGGVGRWLRMRATAARHPRTAVAVLPFQSLGADTAHAYFAGGLHSELLTQLAQVAALQVIGQTSVQAYAGSTKRLREIGDELEAGSIVEGSVQIVGNRLRMTVQLVDAATEKHLWAEQYDRTLDDAFAVQSDIARRIVAGVGATLTSAEARSIAAAPSHNAEAYRLYLQGLVYQRRPGYKREDLEIAQPFLERALALDPGFALAHAALSEVHGDMFSLGYDPSPKRAASQLAEAETALRLAPDMPQAHEAMGAAYYEGRRAYRQASDEFNLALRGAPNDARLWSWIGDVQRRLGNWDSVDAAFTKATQLDPGNVNLFWDLGGETRWLQRRYADAVADVRHALELAPDFFEARGPLGWIYAAWKGELDTLTENWRSPVGRGRVSSYRLEWLLWKRDPDSLLAWTRVAGRVRENAELYRPTALYTAWAYLLRGDATAAHAAFESATVLLDSAVRVLPDDWRVHAARGQALAGLGQRKDALREARWLEQSDVYRGDHFDGPRVAQERAQILARTGRADAALVEIERLLAGPSWLSVHTLRLDPRWDPIRRDPRFQALLAKYANPEARHRRS